MIRPGVDGQPCPWCEASTGYRDLTLHESRLLTAKILVQGAFFGAFNAATGRWGRFRGVLTSGGEFCCRSCNRVIRACPACDTVRRWVNADVVRCLACRQLYS